MYNYEESLFRKNIWPTEINKFIQEQHKACSFSATRGVIYLKSLNKPYARLYGKCGCKVTFEIEIPKKPIPGIDLVCNVKTRGEFELLQSRPTGK